MSQTQFKPHTCSKWTGLLAFLQDLVSGGFQLWLWLLLISLKRKLSLSKSRASESQSKTVGGEGRRGELIWVGWTSKQCEEKILLLTERHPPVCHCLFEVKSTDLLCIYCPAFIAILSRYVERLFVLLAESIYCSSGCVFTLWWSWQTWCHMLNSPAAMPMIDWRSSFRRQGGSDLGLN